MKLVPIVTEKSLADAKEGKFTFYVTSKAKKPEIKRAIGDVFKVNVTSIRTINYKGGMRKNYMGKKITVAPKKRAIVTLAEGQSIDIFETEKKKKKKGKK